MGGNEKMRFTLLRPNRADINAQFELIKPAFNGLEFPKQEFERCKHLVMTKQASFYQLKGEGVNIRFVGHVRGDLEYFGMALSGQGYAKAIPVLIDAIKSQGYNCIKLQAIRPGLVRIYQRFGFSVSDGQGPVKHLTLDLRGTHGR